MTARVDVNTWIGSSPGLALAHPDADILARVCAREQVAGAWVGDMPSVLSEDPHERHDDLFAALKPFPMLRAAPAVHPGREGWADAVTRAAARGAAAISVEPIRWGLETTGAEIRALAQRCAALRLPMRLHTRLLFSFGRETLEVFPEIGAMDITSLVRADPNVRLIVAGAERELIARTRAALSPDLDSRLWWDISHIAGPPADDLAALLRMHGGAQFLYGSGWPFRLTQVPRANLELLPPDVASVSLADADAVGAPRRNPE